MTESYSKILNLKKLVLSRITKTMADQLMDANQNMVALTQTLAKEPSTLRSERS